MISIRELSNGLSRNGNTPVPNLLAAFLIIILFSMTAVSACSGGDQDSDMTDASRSGSAVESAQQPAIPKVIDLGADKCIPCKKMAPILKELREEYKGRFEVVFIDVWKNRDEATRHKIKLIPTQIYFDATGKELFRHQGFASKEDILGAWEKLGYKFQNEKDE